MLPRELRSVGQSMTLLSRFRLRTKLAILLGLSALALIAANGVAATIMHQRMLTDRIDKLRAVTESAIGIAQSLETEVAGQRLSREQALAQFRNAVHAIRFDAGAGYIAAQTLDNMIVVHGANPALEGRPSPARTADGRPLTDLIRAALRDGDSGIVSYEFTKPGESRTQPKLA
jgi:methyl-accepting chemotaxis protein